MQDHDSRGSPCPEAWQTRADQGQGKLGRGRPPEQRQNPKITRAAPLPLVVLSSTQYSIERNLYFWYFTFERLTKFQDCTVFVQKRRTFMIISNNRPVFAKAWRTWWFSVLAQLQRNDKLPVVVYHTLWIDHYAKAQSRTGEGGLFAANLQHTCCPGLGPRFLCGCWRRKKEKPPSCFLWPFSNMSLIEKYRRGKKWYKFKNKWGYTSPLVLALAQQKSQLNSDIS